MSINSMFLLLIGFDVDAAVPFLNSVAKPGLSKPQHLPRALQARSLRCKHGTEWEW